MDKIKRVVNVVIPTTICNFKCHYCYLSQENAFDTNIPKLQYDMDTIKKALTVDRLGGKCLINICAVGETLLAPYLYELTDNMLDNGHYVAIVTNGSIKKVIDKICTIDEEKRKRLFFKFSYQYLELKRQNLIKVFFENVKKVRDSNISFTVEITANDESIKHIEDIKKYCMDEVGAWPHVIESRDNLQAYKKLTKLDNKKHMEAWNSFKTPAIKFQDTVWGEKRTEFCYAGDWEVNLYLQSGYMTSCFAGGPIIQNIFENVEEPIHFRAIGKKCPWSHCFASHVLLTYGVIPELKAPTYEKIRNRKTTDGKEWLGKEMKYFFSHRLNENNQEYSKEKKDIINWYNSLIFENYKKNSKISKSLETILNNNNIKKIGILYEDSYTDEFLELIKDTNIKVNFSLKLEYSIIDNKIRSFIVHRIKYPYKKIRFNNKIPDMKIYDKLPSYDAIIALSIDKYMKAKSMLKDNKPIILLTDLN